MADFLTINGIAIPIADSGRPTREKERIGGGFTRAPNAAGRNSYVARKRLHEYMTSILTPMEAAACAGLIRGEGYLWSFNSNLYDGKGLGPAATSLSTIRTAEVRATVNNPKWGAGCVAVEKDSTNVLPENIRKGALTDTTGFAVLVGATIARNTDTAFVFNGTTSLQVDTAASVGSGVRTSAAVAAGGTDTFSASVYLLGTTAFEVSVKLRNTTAGTNGTAETRTLSTTLWTRFEVTHTATAGDNLEIWIEQTGSAAKVFYADCYQLEQEDFATSWIDGAGATSTRAAGNLVVQPKEVQNLRDLTIILWTRGPNVSGGTQALVSLYPQNAYASGGPYAEISCAGSGGAVTFNTKPTGSVTTVTKSTPWDGGWHQIVAVMRHTGSYHTAIYYDGALGQAATPATLPVFTTVEVGIGCRRASGTPSAHFNGLIDDLVVLPFALDATQIAAVYALGTAYPEAPERLSAAGDSFDGRTVTCFGEVGKESFHQARIAGTWYDNAASVPFTLREE